MFRLPSDSAEEQSVVTSVQCGDMNNGGAPRDTFVKHGFHYLNFGHPYFEPVQCRGLAVQ